VLAVFAQVGGWTQQNVETYMEQQNSDIPFRAAVESANDEAGQSFILKKV
jgi:hypothetical protein